jgi:1-acyl-sn-glycerol-3-phosphate acyltransferase
MLLSHFLIALVRLLVGASPRWMAAAPSAAQSIYFANHTSHIDTLALWSALPDELRKQTRPVAAKDYWGGDALRRYIALRGFNVVLIERAKKVNPDDNGVRESDPLQPLYDVLSAGQSLIIFPEGTRKAQAFPDPFKSGLYHLAQRFPHVQLVPVYLENLHRAMPKGTFIPLPLNCTVRFGAPMRRIEAEPKAAFLERARQLVVDLA